MPSDVVGSPSGNGDAGNAWSGGDASWGLGWCSAERCFVEGDDDDTNSHNFNCSSIVLSFYLHIEVTSSDKVPVAHLSTSIHHSHLIL